MTNKTITEVFKEAKRLKRKGYKLTSKTVIMTYEETNGDNEVIKVRPVTYGEVRKLIKRLK